MKLPDKLTLRFRLSAYCAIWSLSVIAFESFLTVDVGESKFIQGVKVIIFAPLMVLWGLAMVMPWSKEPEGFALLVAAALLIMNGTLILCVEQRGRALSIIGLHCVIVSLGTVYLIRFGRSME